MPGVAYKKRGGKDNSKWGNSAMENSKYREFKVTFGQYKVRSGQLKVKRGQFKMMVFRILKKANMGNSKFSNWGLGYWKRGMDNSTGACSI